MNDLTGVALDPNVRIHESKAFTCNLRKGRKGRKGAGTPRIEGMPHTSTTEGGTIGRWHSEGAGMQERTLLSGV